MVSVYVITCLHEYDFLTDVLPRVSMKKSFPKQAGRLHSLFLILSSFWLMADVCGRAILKSIAGTITRKWCDQSLQSWSKRMLKLLNIHCRIVNPHEVTIPKGRPTILMCNHASLFDIPLSLQVFPHASVRMLAKKELSRIPIMGKGMLAAEFPFIDRHNRRQAIQNLEHVKQLLESGIVMWIAPEGTRSTTGKLGAFKKGGFITAIRTQAVIIPIGIRGAHHILPARSHHFCLGQQAELHIGKPIDAAQFSLDKKDDLIQTVHHAIEQLLGQ